MPADGDRIQCNTNNKTPLNVRDFGAVPTKDLGGANPVFFASAVCGEGENQSLQPCKFVPSLAKVDAFPFWETVRLAGPEAEREIEHIGLFDVLLYVPEKMELVPTELGRVPDGRRPVQGGHEADGTPLYHAVSVVKDVRVPGKCAEHLVSGFAHRAVFEFM